MPRRRLEPDAVRAAAEIAGSIPGAARLLGTSRAAIHARDDLRRAGLEGIATHRAAQPETVEDALRLPMAAALALTEAAREAGEARQDYLGRLLVALSTLPEPVPAGWAHGDMVIRVRVPLRWQQTMRALLGDEYAGRVRAALLDFARGRTEHTLMDIATHHNEPL